MPFGGPVAQPVPGGPPFGVPQSLSLQVQAFVRVPHRKPHIVLRRSCCLCGSARHVSGRRSRDGATRGSFVRAGTAGGDGTLQSGSTTESTRTYLAPSGGEARVHSGFGYLYPGVRGHYYTQRVTVAVAWHPL